MPAVAHRVGLRACAAIGAGCREALESEGRDVAGIDPTRARIVRLGVAAAAELAEIPDTPALAAGDHAFIAPHPFAADGRRDPIVRQMQRLVARYRDECDIDRLIIHWEIADAYASYLARLAGGEDSLSALQGEGEGEGEVGTGERSG